MGRSSNYSQARQKKLQIQNISADKGQKFMGGGKYPSCFGKYPDCPEKAKEFAEQKALEGG